jgi:hypothetical protein
MFDIEDYNCMISDDWSLRGNFYSSNFTYLTIKLNKCVNGTNPAKVVCKPPEVIDEYMSQLTMSFGFVNSMFVPDEYETNPFH